MGCKCKENTDAIGKYADDGNAAMEPLRGLRKAGAVLLRVLFGIFLFIIVIVALPFAVGYVVFMVAFGKSVRINLKKLFRLNDGK